MPNYIDNYDFELFSEPLGLTSDQISNPGLTIISTKLDNVLNLLEEGESINSEIIVILNIIHLFARNSNNVDTARFALFRRNIHHHVSAILNSHRPPRHGDPITINFCNRCISYGDASSFILVNLETICESCEDLFEYNEDTGEYIYIDGDFDEHTPEEYHSLVGLKPFNYNVLGSISFKPPFKPKTLYLGVELELAAKNRTSLTIPEELEHGSLSDFAICKSDSTTGFKGIEIVSCPATFKIHQTAWDAFFQNDATKFTSERNLLGMHVHLSKDCFSPVQIGKLLRFYNNQNNAFLINFICGRASTEYSQQDESRKITDSIKDLKKRFNRFTYVNTNNPSTLELRCFAATTNKNLFMARLEFAQASAEFVQSTSIKALQSSDFLYWIVNSEKRKKKFINLVSWLQLNGFVLGNSPVRPQHFTNQYGV